jgi:hypothetical protein
VAALRAILIAVRNDVMRETQRKQVPWEHSALTGRFYFGLGPPTPAGPAADELSWSLIKDTKDRAQLRRFIEQFPDSKRRPEAERQAAALAAIPRPGEPQVGAPKKAPSPPLPPPAGLPEGQAAPAAPQAAPSFIPSPPSNTDAETLRALSDLVNLGVTARDAIRAKEKTAVPVATPIATDSRTAPGRPAVLDKPGAQATTESAQQPSSKVNVTQANCQQMARQYEASARTAGAPGTMPQLLSMYQYLQCNCGYPPSPQLPPCPR